MKIRRSHLERLEGTEPLPPTLRIGEDVVIRPRWEDVISISISSSRGEYAKHKVKIQFPGGTEDFDVQDLVEFEKLLEQTLGKAENFLCVKDSASEERNTNHTVYCNMDHIRKIEMAAGGGQFPPYLVTITFDNETQEQGGDRKSLYDFSKDAESPHGRKDFVAARDRFEQYMQEKAQTPQAGQSRS